MNQAVVEARLRARGIHVDDVRDLVRSADLQVIKVSKTGESVEKGQTHRCCHRAGDSAVHHAADVRHHYHAFRAGGKDHAHHGGLDLRRDAFAASRRQDPRCGRSGFHAIPDMDRVTGVARILRRRNGRHGWGEARSCRRYTFRPRCCSVHWCISSADTFSTLRCLPP